jgi:uncharacterized membrane protein
VRFRASWQGAVVAAMATVYAVYFAVRTSRVHFGLGTSSYDFGLYEQGTWLMSQFEEPYVTLMGRNLIGDHTSLVLLLVVPIYWIVGSSATLLVVQACVVAAAAVFVYLAAVQLLGGDRTVATVLAAAYLVHPAVSWTVLENFHPDSFLPVAIGGSIWAALRRRWGWYWLFFVLALSVKEDAAVVMALVGGWLAITGGERQGRLHGVASSLVALGTMLTMLFLVMRSITGVTFRNSWRVPFGGFSGVIRTLFTDPRAVLDHFASDGRPWYLWQMIGPTGLVFLRAPILAATASGVLFVNVLSTFWYQYQIGYHYSIAPVVPLVLGTAWALARIPVRWRRTTVAWVALSAALAAFLWSPLPGSRNDVYTWPPSHPVAVAGREIIAVIPDGASVAAFHSLTPHIARRKEIWSLPNPFVRNLYGPDVFAGGDRLPAADRVEFVVLPRNLEASLAEVWMVESVAFDLLAQNRYWLVFRRR